MLNAMSVDVEDYFQVEAFASCVSRKDWESFPSRVERNVARVLELFGRYNTRGTFYVLGWVAERFPHLIRQISKAGHEIGSHGFAHQHIGRQTPESFRKDICEARDKLTNEVQKEIVCYRAPSFSVTDNTLWALEVLAQEGFKIDSSIFPVRHDLYGMPDAPRFPYWRHISKQYSIFEFPPSTVRFGNLNLGVGGGGYFRFLPYPISKRALRHINERECKPAMVYFHPWELDPGQPRIAARFRSKLRHYTNLAIMERKLERLLQDFQFTTVTIACEQLENFRAEASGTACCSSN
jgi:polysaccharide deacetylase family protein (PEP-CTERM system associated)